MPRQMVFCDATLRAIAARNPSALRIREGITGIGENKLALHNDELL